MKKLQSFCVKCQEKKNLNPHITDARRTQGGRIMLFSKCNDCESKLCRITSKEDVDEFFEDV